MRQQAAAETEAPMREEAEAKVAAAAERERLLEALEGATARHQQDLAQQRVALENDREA